MTVHASKGLEFPVVYLPAIVKQRFPMQRRRNPVEPPTGMLPAESEGDAAHERDEACLFYVGATRARDHLVLSYAERYGKKNYKRSAYVDALEAGLPEERITRVAWQDNQAGGRAGTSPARSPSPTLPFSSAWFEPVSSHPSAHFVQPIN